MDQRWRRRNWIIPVVIPLMLFILFNTFYSAPLLRRSMIQEKENQIRDLTEMGISILEHFYSMEEAGELTRSDAQRQAGSLIRDVRFGPENRDYYWINDFRPSLIVHSIRPDLIGVDLDAPEHEEFQALLESFVAIAELEGEGFTRYDWQYYDNQERMEPKISYIKAFEPWGWIIGTGMYADDIERAARSQRNINVIFVITAIQLLLAGFVLFRIYENRKLNKSRNNHE